MKKMIMLGIIVGGTIGGWPGAALDHGNWFGPLSLITSAIGSLAGLYVGYKIGQYIES